jgi:hypothetical protein
VTVPVAVGATLLLPLVGTEPVNTPPAVDELALQDAALADDQVSSTLCPRCMLVACAGVENDAVGAGGLYMPDPEL